MVCSDFLFVPLKSQHFLFLLVRNVEHFVVSVVVRMVVVRQTLTLYSISTFEIITLTANVVSIIIIIFVSILQVFGPYPRSQLQLFSILCLVVLVE